MINWTKGRHMSPFCVGLSLGFPPNLDALAFASASLNRHRRKVLWCGWKWLE
jgi:hypothetical protein